MSGLHDQDATGNGKVCLAGDERSGSEVRSDTDTLENLSESEVALGGCDAEVVSAEKCVVSLSGMASIRVITLTCTPSLG